MQSVFPAPRPDITQRVKGGGGSYAASEPFQIDGVFVFFDWDGLLWMGSLEQGILRVVPKGTWRRGRIGMAHGLDSLSRNTVGSMA